MAGSCKLVCKTAWIDPASLTSTISHLAWPCWVAAHGTSELLVPDWCTSIPAFTEVRTPLKAWRASRWRNNCTSIPAWRLCFACPSAFLFLKGAWGVLKLCVCRAHDDRAVPISLSTLPAWCVVQPSRYLRVPREGKVGRFCTRQYTRVNSLPLGNKSCLSEWSVSVLQHLKLFTSYASICRFFSDGVWLISFALLLQVFPRQLWLISFALLLRRGSCWQASTAECSSSSGARRMTAAGS